MTAEPPNSEDDLGNNPTIGPAGKKPRSRWERAIVWSVILILSAGTWLEWSARGGYQSSLTALENALEEVTKSQQMATAALAFELPGQRLTTPQFVEATRGKMKPGLTHADVAGLVRGYLIHTTPTNRAPGSQFTRIDVYRWQGLLRGYVIRINYVSEPDPVVFNIESE